MPALARVATQGNGWYGYDLEPAGVVERLRLLDRLLAEAGRNRNEIDVFVCPNRHPITPETVAAYREAGVDQLIAPLFARDVDGLKRRAERLLDATRRRVNWLVRGLSRADDRTGAAAGHIRLHP